MTRAHARFRLPPFVIGWRLALDALALWVGLRVLLALVLAASETPSPLLPTPRTSIVLVAVIAALCAVEVRRLGETALLRNLGVSLASQLVWSLAVAGALELTARWLAGSFGAGST